MFTRVKLKNFKCFQEVDVSFRNRRGTVKPRIIITGNTGNGKSTFIASFVFLRNLFDGYYISMLDDSKRLYKDKYPKFNLSCPVLFRHIKPALTTGTTVVIFEFILDGRDYAYEIEFSMVGNLIHEHFYMIRAGQPLTIFKANLNKKEFSPNFFKAPYDQELTELALDIWGEYSLLSILGYYYYKYDELVKENKFNSRLYEIGFFISHLQIESKEANYQPYDRLNLIFNINIPPFSGTISEAGKEKVYFSIIQPALKEIMGWLIPSITDARYEFEESEDNTSYQLYIWQKTLLGEIKLKIDDTSLGIKKTARLCHLLFDGFQGFPIIVDDFDATLHYFVKTEIFNLSVLSNLTQTIVALNTTSLFEHINSSAIYLTQFQNDTYNITNLDDILPTQANHNNRVRYERGLFGKPNQNLNIRFGIIMREVTDNIKKNFYSK